MSLQRRALKLCLVHEQLESRQEEISAKDEAFEKHSAGLKSFLESLVKNMYVA
jgi:hypothetical protein